MFLHNTCPTVLLPQHQLQEVPIKVLQLLNGPAPRSVDATHKLEEMETHAMTAHLWYIMHGELLARTLVPPTLECSQETQDPYHPAHYKLVTFCGEKDTPVCTLETADSFTPRVLHTELSKKRSEPHHGPNSTVLIKQNSSHNLIVSQFLNIIMKFIYLRNQQVNILVAVQLAKNRCVCVVSIIKSPPITFHYAFDSKLSHIFQNDESSCHSTLSHYLQCFCCVQMHISRATC
jgi:hypothetical protein